MVATTIHCSAPHRAALDTDAVRSFLDGDAEGVERAGHHSNSVRLFPTEFLCLRDRGRPGSGGGRDEQYRKLIDRQWHELRRNVDAFKLALGDEQVGDRFGPYSPLIAQLDARTHPAQDREQPDTRRIDTDVL